MAIQIFTETGVMSINRKSERRFISNLTFILFIITNIKNMRIKCVVFMYGNLWCTVPGVHSRLSQDSTTRFQVTDLDLLVKVF